MNFISRLYHVLATDNDTIVDKLIDFKLILQTSFEVIPINIIEENFKVGGFQITNPVELGSHIRFSDQ